MVRSGDRSNLELPMTGHHSTRPVGAGGPHSHFSSTTPRDPRDTSSRAASRDPPVPDGRRHVTLLCRTVGDERPAVVERRETWLRRVTGRIVIGSVRFAHQVIRYSARPRRSRVRFLQHSHRFNIPCMTPVFYHQVYHR